ncbi:RNA 2',3'-cyclic phosphodiesterase [Streptomyces sp. NPDC003444]
MRLFAAVLPPPERLDELGQVVDRLHRLPGADGVRWTARAGWHLTLAFMGEVEDAALPELRARLERAASRTPPFSLRLHGGGHFGRRALWAGVAGDLDALRLLAERSDAAARRAGIAMEEHRRYRAHLTVARGRGDGMDPGPFLEVLDGFEGGRWEAGELTLVRSRLPVGGARGERPRYERVGGWPLGGGADGAG